LRDSSGSNVLLVLKGKFEGKKARGIWDMGSDMGPIEVDTEKQVHEVKRAGRGQGNMEREETPTFLIEDGTQRKKI